MPACVAVFGGATSFEELPTSPSITSDRETRKVVRQGVIAWSDIDALCLECFPNFTIPGRHPTIPYLYADNIECEPFHPNPSDADLIVRQGVLFHRLAKVKISYDTLRGASPEFIGSEDDDGNPIPDFIERTWSISGEFETIPSQSLFWKDINGVLPNAKIQQEDISAVRVIPMIEHNIVLKKRRSIPWEAIRECLGCINSARFSDADTGNLLFIGAEIKDDVNPNGVEEFELTLKFQEKATKHGLGTYGWNFFWRANPGRYDLVVDKNDVPLYSYADFGSLMDQP